MIKSGLIKATLWLNRLKTDRLKYFFLQSYEPLSQTYSQIYFNSNCLYHSFYG